MANDANIIKIKRSGTSGAPASLKLGELAYSYLTASGNPTSNGGDRLFIGANGVNGGTGNANDVIVIGGKYFTDLLDHERGVLTANSALVVDANKKLDELLVDNLSLNGNTIISTDTNGNINITPNGTGKTIISNIYIDASTSLLEYIQDATGGQVTAGEGIDVTYDDTAGTVTISGEDASASNKGIASFSPSYFTVTAGDVAINDATSSTKGIASFNSTDFTVTTGAVTVNSERIQDIVGGMVDSNTESGISVTYDDTAGKIDFNVNDPVITIAGDVDGFATMTNLGDTTITVTLDTVNTAVGTYGSTTSIPVITVNGKGLITGVTTQSISTTLNIAGTTGTDAVALGSDTLTFAGGGAISTAVTDNQVAISVATATSSVLGVASFDSTDFTVSTGAVTVKEERIQDIIGAMVDSNTETNASVTYDDTNGKLNFSVNTATSSTLGVASFNTASFTVTSGDVTIKSAGVSNAQLVNSSFFIGTTSVSLGDTSGTTSSLAVNISGKATTAGTADKVANSLTFAATGGATPNGTFDGSAAKTIDYSSVGAAPSAGSSSIVTVGALTSGSIGAGFTAIPNSALANSKVTVGTTDINLGSSSTTLAGLTQVDVNNIRVTGNTISSTNTDGDIVLDPNGTGTVNASSARITNLSDPTGAQDAATKAYVDATRSGLDVKASVRAATTGNITLANTQTVDGIALAVGNRVLVKNQSTSADNGIYVVASGSWTRAEDCDNTPGTEVTSGMFTFVEEGTNNADSGWVLTTDGAITLGTTELTFVQFSGAGQITAGNGLSKTGNTLDINVANGIEISGDNVQLANSVAGDGLTYTSGVLAVGGTNNRISIGTDAIDISASYIGQTSITTLGTITAGTWNGTALTYAYGGTGQTTYAKGDLLYASASNTLSKLTAGTNGQTLQLQDGVPMWADLDGGTY